MPGLQAGFQSVSDATGVPAVAILSANARVHTETGFVGLVTDIVQFPGAPSTVGNWFVGAARMTVNGIPVIDATSIGIGYLIAPPVVTATGPLQVPVPDAHAQGL